MAALMSPPASNTSNPKKRQLNTAARRITTQQAPTKRLHGCLDVPPCLVQVELGCVAVNTQAAAQQLAQLCLKRVKLQQKQQEQIAISEILKIMQVRSS
jgi:hypothetical protein